MGFYGIQEWGKWCDVVSQLLIVTVIVVTVLEENKMFNQHCHNVNVFAEKRQVDSTVTTATQPKVYAYI